MAIPKYLANPDRTCHECGQDFRAKSHNQKFCSLLCGQTNIRKRGGTYREKKTFECAQCGATVISARTRQMYCSRTCMSRAYNAKVRGAYVTDNRLPPSTVGTISEMRVIADLLNMGYDVYKSVSPACSCDLVAIKDGQPLRVEVTTSHYGLDGVFFSSKPPVSPNYDIVAHFIKPTEEILYLPCIQ